MTMNASVAPVATYSQQTQGTQTFDQRTAHVNELIDAKCNFVMESARLKTAADTYPEMRERCLGLIKVLEGHINTLQAQIDRELQGLLYGLQKSPAPSEFVDKLPG